jgi:hypothetical protein
VGRANLEEYPVEKWARYGYLTLREKLRMTEGQAVERAQELRQTFLHRFSIATITAFALDNPFMQPEARRVMINECERIHRAKPRLKSAEEAMHKEAR